jgi:hypothetical protein
VLESTTVTFVFGVIFVTVKTAVAVDEAAAVAANGLVAVMEMRCASDKIGTNNNNPTIILNIGILNIE